MNILNLFRKKRIEKWSLKEGEMFLSFEILKDEEYSKRCEDFKCLLEEAIEIMENEIEPPK